jgi:hypothetical protein
MSLSKTGLRRLKIGENIYNWAIRKRKTSGEIYYHKKLTAAIQLQTNSEKGLLVVDFGVSPPNTPANPHKTAVTPQIIKNAIDMALQKGWKPREKTTFSLDYPLLFVPDPKGLAGHSEYDTRWTP